MRLVGGKDYYDSALSYGRDDNTVFIRDDHRVMDDSILGKPDDVRLSISGPRLRTVLGLGDSYDHFRHRHRDQNYKIGRLVVMFCGKLHYGLVVHAESYESGYQSIAFYFWQPEKFEEWLESTGLQIATDAIRWERSDPQALAKLFATVDASSAQMEWLITNMVTIAIRMPTARYERHSTTWEINPARLKEVEFFRKINAYQAFQEIEMWVGGVLPQISPDMAAIDDATRLAKHGFDKTSFRKAKAKAK